MRLSRDLKKIGEAKSIVNDRYANELHDAQILHDPLKYFDFRSKNINSYEQG